METCLTHSPASMPIRPTDATVTSFGGHGPPLKAGLVVRSSSQIFLGAADVLCGLPHPLVKMSQATS